MLIDKDDNLTFHPQFVKPYYGGLMNCNFAGESFSSKPIIFLKEVRDLQKELSNQDILTLLNSSWRPSKVGAWLIGLNKIEELREELISYLKSRPVYCEHVITNLIIFNKKDSNEAVLDFSLEQLQLILQAVNRGKDYEAIDIFQKHSVEVALVAIKFLDSINDTQTYQTLINSDSWQKICKGLEQLANVQPRKKGTLEHFLTFDATDFGIGKAMEIVGRLRT